MPGLPIRSPPLTLIPVPVAVAGSFGAIVPFVVLIGLHFSPPFMFVLVMQMYSLYAKKLFEGILLSCTQRISRSFHPCILHILQVFCLGN